MQSPSKTARSKAALPPASATRKPSPPPAHETDLSQLSPVESIKASSRFLRGTILEGLADRSTGALAGDDTQLTKFHGFYQQDDRDVRKERRKQKLEPAYSFMIRVRIPGGVCTPKQWLAMDRIATEHANGTLKLTTRQAFQFHGVIKSNLRATIREINANLLDTIAACGDVNRNVMCNPNPDQSRVHAEVYQLSRQISDHLLPRTPAYHEIWLDDGSGEPVQVTEDPAVIEPLYGKQYLPRKFKIVIAVPPSNDVDVFAHCLGFIAIADGDVIQGYNVTVGGGMGTTHGNVKTYPRLADVLGFCTPDQVVDVAEKVMTVQRDFGDRKDRKHSRLKYTVEDMGLERFRKEVEDRLGYRLDEPRPFHFEHNGDRYGWVTDHRGLHHLTLYISGGRVKDTADFPLRSGLREIARIHKGDFRLTANQNLVIANIKDAARPKIEETLAKFGIGATHHRSGLRLNSIACVALPTCGLALAESERYLPDLLGELEELLEENGLRDDAITIRMTGCPNGCARPFLAEIGLVGRAPGTYNLYLGGGFAGNRLNKLWRESVKAPAIKDELRPLFAAYARNRLSGERFGDFCIRTGIVKETTAGRDFHA